MSQISEQLKEILRSGMGWDKFGESINNISELVLAIGESEGDEWVNKIKDRNGQPLIKNEQEKQRFTELFHKISPTIRHVLKGETFQQGGEEPLPTNPPNPTNPTNSAPKSLSESLKGQMAAMPPIDIDIDKVFTGLVSSAQRISQYTDGLASNYGLMKLERDFDKEDDFHAVPEPIRVMIGSLGAGGMSIKTILDKIKVPYRFIVFLVYLYLDISRLAASTAGFEGQQRMYTIILALLELFRGDWKKAVLTFMGLYGSTPLFVGQIAKVFLYLFERLSPTIQDRMIYGVWDTSKSLLLGILLSICQVTAPMSVRKPLMDILQTLSDGKKELDKTLIEAGLEPRSDQFEPTWSDLNRLQAVNDDPVFICSCEYQELIKNIGDSAIMRLILQLLRMPVNEEMRKKYTCVDRTPCKPFIQALKEEQTATGTPSATTPATIETPSGATPTPATATTPTGTSAENPAASPIATTPATPATPATTPTGTSSETPPATPATPAATTPTTPAGAPIPPPPPFENTTPKPPPFENTTPKPPPFQTPSSSIPQAQAQPQQQMMYLPQAQGQQMTYYMPQTQQTQQTQLPQQQMMYYMPQTQQTQLPQQQMMYYIPQQQMQLPQQQMLYPPQGQMQIQRGGKTPRRNRGRKLHRSRKRK
jgi:hypothetical protein